MSDFNMPPGVRVSDIPGNRPEDEAWEVFCDKVYDKLVERHMQYFALNKDEAEKKIESLRDMHGVEELLWWAVDIAAGIGYKEGYDSGIAEAVSVEKFGPEDL